MIPEAGLNIVQEACEAAVWPEAMPPPYDTLQKLAL
jgi:hypothetical protein